MADDALGNGKNGSSSQEKSAGPGDATNVQAQVIAQYVKDLSFENPNVDRLLAGPGSDPNMKIEVNVGGRKLKDDLFESAIDLKAHATDKDGTIYDLEIIYAGLFRIKNIPEHAIEPFLLINCPVLLFPFLRRMVADVSREGGFPPLMLDPIDFGGLYMQRKQQESGAQTN